MTTAEIIAAARARALDAAAAVEAQRAAEIVADAELRAAVRDLSRATDRHRDAHYEQISVRARLGVARDALAAHGALVELLSADPALIEDLHYLTQPPSLTAFVTPARLSALGCRGLIDRRHKPSSSVFSPSTPLTAAGWAVLELYREIIGYVAPTPPHTED